MSRPTFSCQVVDSLSTGGAERLVALQAVELSRAGHRVHVVSLAEPLDGPVTDQLRQSSIPISYVPAEGRYSLLDRKRANKLTEVVAGLSPDVVHPHLDTSIIVGSQSMRALDCPVAVTLHGSAPDFRRLAGLKRPLLHRALRRADRVIAVGPQVAETWRSVVAGLDPVVVLNPVTGLGGVVEREARVGSVGRPVELLAVGRLVHQKAYEVMVEAMRIVVNTDSAVRCRIAGEGPERADIEAAIADCGLGDHVQLLGNRTDVNELLAQSDLFVSSSSSEGLPVSVLEAMASGMAVVCTDVGDVRAAVPDDAGTVVSPNAPGELADALLALIKDGDRRIRCGQAGRRHVEDHHDPVRWAEGLASLYTDMVDGTSDDMFGGTVGVDG